MRRRLLPSGFDPARFIAVAFIVWRGCEFAPGAVAGDRIERVFAGRAQIDGRSIEEVRAAAMAAQSIKAMISQKDIAALAVFLASDAAKSISGQVLPNDNDRQRA